jgi:hypothetical protein
VNEEDEQQMAWLKGIGGVLCVVIGGVWIAQGTGVLPGSVMSGQSMWAIIGLVVLAIGVWLLWSLARARRGTAGSPRG